MTEQLDRGGFIGHDEVLLENQRISLPQQSESNRLRGLHGPESRAVHGSQDRTRFIGFLDRVHDLCGGDAGAVFAGALDGCLDQFGRHQRSCAIVNGDDLRLGIASIEPVQHRVLPFCAAVGVPGHLLESGFADDLLQGGGMLRTPHQHHCIHGGATLERRERIPQQRFPQQGDELFVGAAAHAGRAAGSQDDGSHHAPQRNRTQRVGASAGVGAGAGGRTMGVAPLATSANAMRPAEV